MIRKDALLAGIVAVMVLILAVSIVYTPPEPPEEEPNNPVAIVHTSYGDFTIELYENLVPELTDHFIKYAISEFYNDMVFHSIYHPMKMGDDGKITATKGSMLMTGIYSSAVYHCIDVAQNDTDGNLTSSCIESTVQPAKYMIEYGRTDHSPMNLVHEDLMVSWYKNNASSSTQVYSQFYICNGSDLTGYGPRSARLDAHDPVFGKVVSGVDVIRRIASSPTNRILYNKTGNENLTFLPDEPVVIRSIDIVRKDEVKITTMHNAIISYASGINGQLVQMYRYCLESSQLIEKNINQKAHTPYEVILSQMKSLRK